MKRTLVALVALLLIPAAFAQRPNIATEYYAATRIAVAWNDSADVGGALIAAMETRAPFAFVTPALRIDADAVLHRFGRRLYAVSPSADTITAIDWPSWSIVRVYTLPEGSEPLDIAVVSSQTAYVSRAAATHLLRLDLTTGATAEATDLTPVAGDDGVPDMDRMIVVKRRLFVQLKRIDNNRVGTPPALAVVDLATEALVDANPLTAPIDPINLVGTAPRMRMQPVGPAPRLYVSATGMFFDEGGIEVVDIESLQSLGLAIAEADDETGADLGAFVLVKPELGYLTFSTDLLTSSHLHAFTPFVGTDPAELHVSLSYFAPALAYDALSGTLYVPHALGDYGVHVFDAATGRQLTTSGPTATTGPVADLLPLYRLAISPTWP